MRFIFKTPVCCGLLVVITLLSRDVSGQINGRVIYREADFKDKIDSLRKTTKNIVLPAGDPLETATYVALSHYPELAGHTIKIKYKKTSGIL